MLTSYASWRSIGVFTMVVPSPCKCKVFCNSRNSLTCHNKIMCTIVITSCGGNNIIKWTTKVMQTSYASWRSIGVFSMAMSGLLHICQTFFNTKNSFRDHKNICTILLFAVVNGIWSWWTTKVMLTFYASARSTGIFTMPMPSLCMLQLKKFIDMSINYLHHSNYWL